MTIALLASAAASSGCLVLDPVTPIDDASNTNPSFYFVSPGSAEIVFLPNNSQSFVFRAKARDLETDDEQLFYEWTVDNGSVVQEGPDSTEYLTNGAALGAGIHLIGVLVTDDGLPTGFETLEWQVQVQ